MPNQKRENFIFSLEVKILKNHPPGTGNRIEQSGHYQQSQNPCFLIDYLKEILA